MGHWHWGQTLQAEIGGRASGGAVGAPSDISDAVSALVNLGYSPSQALGVVTEASVELGEGPTVGALIKAGLTKLAPSDTRMGGRG